MIAEKLQQLNQIKEDIKQALIEKGLLAGSDMTEYALLIKNIAGEKCETKTIYPKEFYMPIGPYFDTGIVADETCEIEITTRLHSLHRNSFVGYRDNRTENIVLGTNESSFTPNYFIGTSGNSYINFGFGNYNNNTSSGPSIIGPSSCTDIFPQENEWVTYKVSWGKIIYNNSLIFDSSLSDPLIQQSVSDAPRVPLGTFHINTLHLHSDLEEVANYVGISGDYDINGLRIWKAGELVGDFRYYDPTTLINVIDNSLHPNISSIKVNILKNLTLIETEAHGLIYSELTQEEFDNLDKILDIYYIIQGTSGINSIYKGSKLLITKYADGLVIEGISYYPADLYTTTDGTNNRLAYAINDNVTVDPGWYAQAGNTKLLTATLNNATNIPGYFTTDCVNLKEMYAPVATSIGNYAFLLCYNLQNIDIPLVTSVGSYSFLNCWSLTDLNLPELTIINNFAFNLCYQLTNLNVDWDKITTIATTAFLHCWNLKLPTEVPANVATFPNGSLYNCCYANPIMFLDRDTIPTLGNTSTFNSQALFVRDDLFSLYLTATLWLNYCNWGRLRPKSEWDNISNGEMLILRGCYILMPNTATGLLRLKYNDLEINYGCKSYLAVLNLATGYTSGTAATLVIKGRNNPSPYWHFNEIDLLELPINVTKTVITWNSVGGKTFNCGFGYLTENFRPWTDDNKASGITRTWDAKTSLLLLRTNDHLWLCINCRYNFPFDVTVLVIGMKITCTLDDGSTVIIDTADLSSYNPEDYYLLKIYYNQGLLKATYGGHDVTELAEWSTDDGEIIDNTLIPTEGSKLVNITCNYRNKSVTLQIVTHTDEILDIDKRYMYYNNNGMFITDYYPNTNTRIVGDFTMTATNSNSVVWGSESTDRNLDTFKFWINGSRQTKITMNTSEMTGPTVTLNQKYHAEQTKTLFFLDGVLRNASFGTNFSNVTSALAIGYLNRGVTWTNNKFRGNIYTISIYEKDELIHQYVPYADSTLVDTVTGMCYTTVEPTTKFYIES